MKFTEDSELRATLELSEQSQLRFLIEDTGIAVADGDYDRLFDAFAQGGNEIRQRFGGTGLGLALCRELVQSMGGEISTRALESRGSRPSVEANRPAPARSSPGRSEHVRRTGIQTLIEPVSIRPLIALTADAFAQQRDEALSVGCDDHLGKPINRATIQATVCKWLEAESEMPTRESNASRTSSNPEMI